MGIIMSLEIMAVFLFGMILSSIILTLIQALKNRKNRKNISELEATVSELKNNFNALCSGSAGVTKRISRLESKTRQQAERQFRMEHKAPDLQSYGNAARLANKGADTDELIDHCGLSRGEAELILFLNTQQQAQSAH